MSLQDIHITLVTTVAFLPGTEQRHCAYNAMRGLTWMRRATGKGRHMTESQVQQFLFLLLPLKYLTPS